MKHVETDWLDPFNAAMRLRRLGRLAFLDSAMPHETLGRYSIVAADPFCSFTVDAAGPMLDGERLDGKPLDALKDCLVQFRTEPIPGLPPFQGGAIGYIAYEFAHHLETLDIVPGLDPDRASLHLEFYDTALLFDLTERRSFLVSTGHPATGEDRQRRATERIEQFLEALGKDPEPLAPVPRGFDWRSNVFGPDYEAAIEKTRQYILSGDIFQANIAQTFTSALPGGFDALALYERLRETNAAPFAAFLEFGETTIASSSPERFLKLDGRHVETRPIKGTIRRSKDVGEDAGLSAELLASDKDRAENVMIVDLMRNDLSRVCEADSVDVPVLCGLETYAAVHHLVSVVTGTLQDDLGATDLVAASFPGGSITGAPKIRAMNVITEIEGTPRGPYCGSIGYFSFTGAMDLNIAIRTVTFEDGTAKLAAGGGITVLSDPKAEYEETFTKATRVFAAFEGEG